MDVWSSQYISLMHVSLVPTRCVPPSEKWSGECSRISWAYSQKLVKTNDIARLLIITWHFPYNMFISIRVSMHTWALLGYTVRKAPSPGNLTWFTKPFLLVRGWGLGTRLDACGLVYIGQNMSCTCSRWHCATSRHMWCTDFHIRVNVMECTRTYFTA